MKAYSAAPTIVPILDSMQSEFHDELQDVTVGVLFVFDLESSLPVLKHQGYAAQAVIRITPLRERALGVPDATIVVDRANWIVLSQRQREGVVDHELTHLERVVDSETGKPVNDALDRPKLRIRRHDHQLGWFDEVAQRHGDASAEVRQAKALIASTGQLYFDFNRRAGAVAQHEDADVTITVGKTTVKGKASEIRRALEEVKSKPTEDPDMLVWWHNGVTLENSCGKRRDMPPGCIEIDPPAGDASDRQQRAAEAVA